MDNLNSTSLLNTSSVLLSLFMICLLIRRSFCFEDESCLHVFCPLQKCMHSHACLVRSGWLLLSLSPIAHTSFIYKLYWLNTGKLLQKLVCWVVKSHSWRVVIEDYQTTWRLNKTLSRTDINGCQIS